MQCNRNCFECTLADCDVDEMSIEECSESIERDFQLGIKHHSSEKDKLRSRQYYSQHQEQVNARSRAYYHSHKEQFREYNRLWRKSHAYDPEKAHRYYLNWKAKKQAAKDN